MSHTPDTAHLLQQPVQGSAGQPHPHDSARRHVTGSAPYVDDMAELPGTVHIAIGKSPIAHGRLNALHLDDVRTAEGVIDILTFADLPAETDVGPVFKGDPLLVEKEISFYGQPLFAVAARSHRLAKQAALSGRADCEAAEPVLDIAAAMRQNRFVRPPHFMQKGDAAAVLAAAEHTLSGKLYVRGQEHFYLETQVSYAIPEDDGGVTVYCSTQHPSEVQKLVAEVLGIPLALVRIIVRRLGGGFGGKETQAAPWACLAALFAVRLKRPAKLRLDRQDDMQLTGKRHDFANEYRAAFDADGKIQAADIRLAALCGYSPDLSDAIVDRAMFHSDNAYHYPNALISGYRCQTHTVSNTAFRGFGGPQGVIAAEALMEDIAQAVGHDALDVRYTNLYQEGDSTHYGQKIEHFYLPELMRELEQSSGYRTRREAVGAFNRRHRHQKRGLALTPVKFGISFTVTFLNQGGALVHIYTDGSVHLNHGGVEMGQGLFTKVAQIVAAEFALDIERIKISATDTDKVPNTSATAASSGTDLNGMAAQNACRTLKQRLLDFIGSHFDRPSENVRFWRNHVLIADNDIRTADNDALAALAADPQHCRCLAFGELATLAYQHSISLSASGFYATPEIYYHRDSASGKPFYYFAFGAACSEVEIDTLTGEYRVLRSDILHDVGRSINPAVDIGQIEGGFIQGMGWLTTEDLRWNDNGRLDSAAAATYKIPTAADVPEIFNVALYHRANPEATVYHSKAVGEPPFMLGISVWCALRDAVAACADYRVRPELNAPATPEEILHAVNRVQSGADNAV
ncbi:xanthine dehydrogenase molybdopterin binding subunit [Uruburuella testudinis]|uniref:Xanthine dehydrogenase molybdopterin binding subunit n=1 Tax=Uruburuella testudinis TaxID=1282863 RepID=A0ABY4DR84_9NEIS|nr:xanthine dehydrogenase molybdopterin binding subunit [Uruburuella testudinis]UOO81225.1 xanthine dehydrogenase molybdopterin binding subunit [Uruburuella testudinis]